MLEHDNSVYIRRGDFVDNPAACHLARVSFETNSGGYLERIQLSITRLKRHLTLGSNVRVDIVFVIVYSLPEKFSFLVCCPIRSVKTLNQ